MLNSPHNGRKYVVRNIGSHHAHGKRFPMAAGSMLHISAAAPAAYHQPVVLQQGYGLAHRLTANLKAALEFLFGGQ